MSATAKVQFNQEKYSRLLAKFRTRAITSKAENKRVLAIVNDLMRKGEGNTTPEEDVVLELLFALIEKFEQEFYQLEKNSTSTPVSVLKHLMEGRDLAPKDLWPILGSRGLTSEVLSGKRAISKSRAKSLAEFFHVSAELFI